MQVFKAALRIFFKHPVYLFVYVMCFSCMGLFVGISSFSAPQDEFVTERPNIAIIDRDGSDLSKGLAEFLGGQANVVDVEDSRRAMQDATAQDLAAYIMVIPDGFGKDFVSAAASGQAAPTIETVTSYESISGNMMNALVEEYLNTARLYASSNTTRDQAEIVAFTNSDMANDTTVTLLQFGDSAPVSQQWVIYMQFSGYTIMLAIIVLVGVVLVAFNRTDIRRRNLTASISSLSMNLQLMAACLVATLLAWAWVSILGLVAFGHSLAGVDPLVIGLCISALLAFCLVALAIGFFLGQIASSELVLNAAGNIIGLVLSFLGGLWIPLSFMGGTMEAVAHFTPTFYYGDAITKAIGLQDFTGASLTPIAENIGIILLFAATIAALALVAGRLRMQSAEAGGNAAAARTRS